MSSARPPVSCLCVWSSTVNNDAISRLQICSPRCWIYCAEPDILTGTGLATDLPTVHQNTFQIGASKTSVFSRADTVGLKVANTDWGTRMYNLCWQLDDRDNRTRITGHNQVITSQWKCPQRSFPHWQGVMSWTQWPGIYKIIYKIISGSTTTCKHELDIFIYDQKL